ncbi:Adenylate cyclase [Acidisarcina polymorpha]|uniref:Adenylate cyclase n=1 Tax=Acidisarcina polymorpha TaxID=2211140 RepID=A0A2Z5G075_9BACT|nr:hypothetical protein [Acidisarcina polymorpha]AXC12045.1 Adenylate cyclase [Acidisarcina polymorpha]
MATLAAPLLSKADHQPEEPNRIEVLKQLERIIGSPHFRNSKRYPNLLKFAVEHTLAGRTDLLKERTLGIEVFGRLNDYDTSADPVVRVTAGEIRKRIAQYYQAAGHRHELRIELPIGSYVPQFLLPESPTEVLPADVEDAPAEISDRVLDPSSGVPSDEPTLDASDSLPAHLTQKPSLSLHAAMAILILGILIAGAGFIFRQQPDYPGEKGIDYFWKPILAADGPALIVIGVHSLDSSGNDLSPALHVAYGSEDKQNMLSSMIRSEMVPVSDIVSYSHLTRLLTRRDHSFETQGASETTFEQLQRGPVVLIGGFDNVWTLRLTSTLRYRFENPRALLGVIVDSKHPDQRWSFDNGQSAVSDSRDYAIVASLFDPRIQQQVLIVAGIGKSGTAAAAEFLTNDKYLATWLAQAKVTMGKNVEIVLSTEILEGQQGPPQVIASQIW